MTKIKSVTAAVVIAAINFASAHDPGCMYMKCEFKFKGGYHDECLGTDGRSLIRDVECSNGNTIHICCKLPYREDIQKSRQARFRFVTRLATNPILNISPNCIKRVLCELSCKDGLSGLSRSSYPEVFSSENLDQEYIKAFEEGEAQSCYQTSNDTEDKLYDDISCENDCHSKYPECIQDMKQSCNSKLFYESARIFQALGLWLFSAEWLVRDKMMEVSEKSVEVGAVTKQAFTLLLQRMDDLSWDFNEKRLKTITPEMGKKAESEDINVKWNTFLLTYNAIDAELVEAIYEALTYEEFEDKRNVTKEILASHAFDSGIWIENKANIIMLHAHQIFYASAIIWLRILLF